MLEPCMFYPGVVWSDLARFRHFGGNGIWQSFENILENFVGMLSGNFSLLWNGQIWSK